MKLIALSSAALILSVVAPATYASPTTSPEEQARADGDKLIPSCRFPKGLCGYYDRDGNVAIPPSFDWVDRFREGRALIGRKGLFGFINDAGHVIVEPRFERAAAFHNGHAQVMVGGKAGLIDASGKFVIEPRYTAAEALSSSLFWVDDGDEPRPLEPRDILASPRRTDPREAVGRWGIRKADGTWRIPPTFASISLFAAPDSSAFRVEQRSPGQKSFAPPGVSGLIALDGAWLIEPPAEIADLYLSDGRARFRRDGKWGFIDGRGRIAIEPQFDDVRPFYHGRASVKVGGKWGVIDKDGKWLFKPFRCTNVLKIEGDFAEVQIAGKRLWIDREGLPAKGPRSVTPDVQCPNGISLRTYLGKKQFVDASDTVIGGRDYDSASLTCGRPSPVGLIGDDGKTHRWGFVDEGGAIMIEPQFKIVEGFFTSDSKSFVVAARAGEWGLLHRDGTFLPKPQYKDMSWIDSDRLSVTGSDNRRYWINAREQEIEAPNDFAPWDSMNCPDDINPQKAESGRWGYADFTGRVVIAAKYEAATCFRHGIAWVAIPDQRRWCAIDKAGEHIAGVQCAIGPPMRVIYEPGPIFPGNDDYERGLSRFWSEARTFGPLRQ